MNDVLFKIVMFSIVVLIDVTILFFTVIKKTKIVTKDTVFEQLLVRLPAIINQAEKLFGNGFGKKSFALGCSYSFLSQYLGLSVQEVAEKYEDKISNAIEDILSTPQRKESI